MNTGIFKSKKWTIFLFLLLGLAALSGVSAQGNLITVEKVLSKRKPRITETYQINADTPDVRQGTYSKWVNKKLTAEGYYRDNLQDSIWKGYSDSEKVFEGSFQRDQRIGIWSFYTASGQLLHQYDFSKDSLVFYDNSVASETFIEKVRICAPGDTSPCEAMPVFLGGNRYLSWMIDFYMVYPRSSKENGVQGTVIMSCVVDKSGNTTQIELVKGVNKEINAEALRLIGLLGKIWIPGKVDNNPVKVKFSIPLKFKLV